MSTHIVKSYDDELAVLDRLVVDMGSLADKMLGDCVEALERRDSPLAERTISNDRALDQLERQIQERAIGMIARRQPVADDLRHVMTVLKIAGDLERVGDLAKNIATRASAISNETWPPSLSVGLTRLTELARGQLKAVLEAFQARDDAKALAVWLGDARLDDLYGSVFQELLAHMVEEPRTIGLCAHLHFGAKNLERIGDHTTNIAENIHFLVTGRLLPDERPKGGSSSTSSLGKPMD